ncbi:hypothetical protein [Cognatazoarcus halotolerans]|uniref:hypothetical protein n=1 Tax=Cognatazoarcus halotolerans TaxID=2686016 RepID=UPI001F30E7D6|nr:hypothetical protein [Cognatazoarcus halotolerans]
MKQSGLRGRLAGMVLAATISVLSAGPVLATDDTVTGDRGADMAIDLVVVRPLGLAATVVGAVGWVVALPFTLPTGQAGETAHQFVGRPFEYTFNRPLGDMDHCGRDAHPCGNR